MHQQSTGENSETGSREMKATELGVATLEPWIMTSLGGPSGLKTAFSNVARDPVAPADHSIMHTLTLASKMWIPSPLPSTHSSMVIL